MDTSVALVQAYLHVNGYFTVAEYPVLEASRGEHARSVTDLDILAFRFAGAGHEVVLGRGRRPLSGRAFAVDPVLECPADRPDMIVGEVKEGAARLNDAMRDPVVLEVALTRFGCCAPEHAGHRESAARERSRDRPGGSLDTHGCIRRCRRRRSTWTLDHGSNATRCDVPASVSKESLVRPTACADP